MLEKFEWISHKFEVYKKTKRLHFTYIFINMFFNSKLCSIFSILKIFNYKIII